jgi:hypothetical protein
LPDKLVSMGEPEEDAAHVEPSEAAGASAESDAKRKNDSTIALSEQEFQALQVPSAPPAIPTPRPGAIPTPRPGATPIPRNDASMWAGSVLVADEFEPLEVPKNPMGRWLLLAFFGLGVVGAALYFLWWRPAQDVDASEPVAKAAEPAPAAAPAPAPPPAAAPAAEAAPPPAAQPAVAAPEKPAVAPAPKKTASKKKSSKKKSSSKKKTSSKKKKSSKKRHHGG